MKRPIAFSSFIVAALAACGADAQRAETEVIQSEARPGPRPTLSVGLMVHLEGWPVDNDAAWARYTELMTSYGALFDAHGAKMTLESKETTRASLERGDTTLAELNAAGHHTGVHADVGGRPDPRLTTERFAMQIASMKSDLDALGLPSRHVSGICSGADWVTAALDAGYEMSSGIVAYCLMSLPEADRPEEFRNCPSASQCHQAYPVELAGRLSPWRARSGADWTTPSTDGGLVIIPSSGGLACFAEEAADDSSHTSCTFAADDIDAYFDEMDAALALTRRGRVNTFYISWSFGQPLDEVLLEQWLMRHEPYVAAGLIEWKTLPEMYDDFVAWESRR